MKKLSWPNIAALLFAFFSLLNQVSCATIIGGEKKVNTTIESMPPGAKIYDVEGTIICEKTPCQQVFDTRDDVVLKAELDGHYSLVKSLDHPLRTFAWLNILWINPLLIGAAFGIDYVSGSLWTVATPQIFKLKPLPEEGGDEETDKGSEAENKAPAGPTPSPVKPNATDTPWDILQNNAKDGTTQAPTKESTEKPVIEPRSPKLDTPNTEVKSKESESTGQETTDDLHQRFPIEYMRKQVRYYYGAMSPSQAEAIVNRLYRSLQDMIDAGEKPNIDEVIRRDLGN